LLIKASRERHRYVIRFLWAKGLGANAIHSEMRPVHGRESVAEEKRPGCGQHRFFAAGIQKRADRLD